MNPGDHRTMRFHYAAALLACAMAVIAGSSCDADLETGCIDGACTGATTGSGGSCAGIEHDLPCDVYDVLSTICQQCHVPGGQGPFPLLEYCDTQQQYGNKPIWVRMQAAIKPDAFPRMPLGQDPLADDQMAALNAWFDTCGSNVEPFDAFQCAGAQNGPPPVCGEGGAGGGGGAPQGGAPQGGAPAGGAPAGGAGGI